MGDNVFVFHTKFEVVLPSRITVHLAPLDPQFTPSPAEVNAISRSNSSHCPEGLDAIWMQFGIEMVVSLH